MKDLFGKEIVDRPKITAESMRERKRRNRRYTRPQGYADKPGTGPEGETCKSCRFKVFVEYSKKYNKCHLVRKNWTGGPGSDIRVRAAACSFWQSIPPDVIEARKAVDSARKNLPVGAVNGPEWQAFSTALDHRDQLEAEMLK